MASAAPYSPRQVLQELEKLATQMGLEAGPGKIRRIEQLAGEFVPVYEQCTADLARREEALEARVAELAADKAAIEEASASLKSQETLAKISEGVDKINARGDEFKTSLSSLGKNTAEEGRKTGTIVAQSEANLSGQMQADHQACMTAIRSSEDHITTDVVNRVSRGVWLSLGFGVRCVNQAALALDGTENRLALKSDQMMTAVQDSEEAVMESVSSCEQTLLQDGAQTRENLVSCRDTLLEHGNQTRQGVVSSRDALLQDGAQTRESLSSCERILGDKLASVSSALEGLKQEMNTLASSGREDVTREMTSCREVIKSLRNFVEGMGESLAESLDANSTELDTHNKQYLADLQSHIDSKLDSKSKESVIDVKTALETGLGDLSEAVGLFRTEVGAATGEDRLKSVFKAVSRDDEILQSLGDVQAAIPQPDNSVLDAVSELKDLLASKSKREQELEEQLAEANEKVKSVAADLEKSQGEQEQLRGELDQLKTKLPDTPGRSAQGSGSDDSLFSMSSQEEREMVNLPDLVLYGPAAPTMADLRQRIRELEDESQKWDESMVSKDYLDNAMRLMFERLSVKDDQATQVAELQKRLEEAEAKLAAAEAAASEAAASEAAAFEAPAQNGNGNRTRKRSRLIHEASDLSQGSDESLFKSMCSGIHNAMNKAFAYPEREERLMRFIRGDETGRLLCFGSLLFREDPSAEDCMCNELDGIMGTQCLSVRVLDRNTMEVEFVLEDLMA